jgi:hypothetical protein
MHLKQPVAVIDVEVTCGDRVRCFCVTTAPALASGNARLSRSSDVNQCFAKAKFVITRDIPEEAPCMHAGFTGIAVRRLQGQHSRIAGHVAAIEHEGLKGF